MQFIMNDILKPEHRKDPLIISIIGSYLDCRDIRQTAKDTQTTTHFVRKMLNRKDIHDCIVAITDNAVFKHGIDPTAIVERVKEFVELDPSCMVNPETGAAVTNLHELPPEVRRAIKKFKVKNLYETDPNGIKQVVGQLVEYEFYDKLKSTEMLGREVDLFKETTVVQHEVGKNMRDTLLAAKERAEARELEHREMRDVGES